MSRYVLDDARAIELLQDFSMYDDFPVEPGQVRGVFRNRAAQKNQGAGLFTHCCFSGLAA